MALGREHTPSHSAGRAFRATQCPGSGPELTKQSKLKNEAVAYVRAQSRGHPEPRWGPEKVKRRLGGQPQGMALTGLRSLGRTACFGLGRFPVTQGESEGQHGPCGLELSL